MAPKSNQTARRAKAKAKAASRNRAGAASGATTPSAHNDDSMWQYFRAKPIATPENMYVAMTLFEALSEDDKILCESGRSILQSTTYQKAKVLLW